MPKATRNDKYKVVEILTKSFLLNPGVNWLIKQDKHRQKRIKAVVDFAFEKGIRNDGVYLSSDGTGAAICYEQASEYHSVFLQMKLVLKAFDLKRIPTISYRESYRKQIRSQHGNFLNLWFYGVKKADWGNGTAAELKNELFEKSNYKQLPLLLETTELKNKNVYERYGFKVYHFWEEPDNEI